MVRQVREHAFFAKAPGFSWTQALAMAHPPPLHSAADTARDAADVTRSNDKYTKQRPALSPVRVVGMVTCRMWRLLALEKRGGGNTYVCFALAV